ncbi:hypothetical protein NDU88_003823 [Pleurodeles waltl]|uniref:Uncharacterized protein n=1 Tax=Pleurodeles waltl TaxID=8319 RepID=A0AAV7RF04_PLEWA|nr:hypothetical protein NDU88_003823 [Pleurodeles waltl]
MICSPDAKASGRSSPAPSGGCAVPKDCGSDAPLGQCCEGTVWHCAETGRAGDPCWVGPRRQHRSPSATAAPQKREGLNPTRVLPLLTAAQRRLKEVWQRFLLIQAMKMKTVKNRKNTKSHLKKNSKTYF